VTISHDPTVPYAERIGHILTLIPTPARRELYERAMALVDWPRLEAIRRDHSAALATADPDGQYKYLDIPYWTWTRFGMVEKLRLESLPRQRVLDLGCGCAHVGLLARALGHDYTGTDIVNPLYGAICAAMSVRHVTHRVEKGVALPDFGGPFDIVTAFDISFHFTKRPGASGARDYWTPEDWSCLLIELSKQMSHGGRFVFTPNQQRRDDGVFWHDPVIYDNFGRLGSKPLIAGESHTLDLLRADLLAAVAAQKIEGA
jgi:SAM-dependent methyltransferase